MESTTESIAVTRELVIDASPETVWELITDPEKIVLWKGLSVTLDPTAGGAYRCQVLKDSFAAGEVIEFDPPHRLVHTWGWEGGELPPGATTIEYELVPEGAGTRLKFTHRDLPNQEAADSHAAGWDHYFERLAVVAAGGNPGPDPWLERNE